MREIRAARSRRNIPRRHNGQDVVAMADTPKTRVHAKMVRRGDIAMGVMRVALENMYHAGDVILCRPLIRRVRPLLIDRVALELRCQPRYRYLWEDLGLPMRTDDGDADVRRIDLWFGAGDDAEWPRLLGESGLSHRTHVTSYNRQAKKYDLPTIDVDGEVPPIDWGPGTPPMADPGVLVENGPVLSGQQTVDLNPFLVFFATAFPHMKFYCCAKPPPGPPNLIDCSAMNLIEISRLSEICVAMLARLSGPFVATLTSANVGRLPRLVYGNPIGCDIFDERDVSYFSTYDQVEMALRKVLS